MKEPYFIPNENAFGLSMECKHGLSEKCAGLQQYVIKPARMDSKAEQAMEDENCKQVLIKHVYKFNQPSQVGWTDDMCPECRKIQQFQGLIMQENPVSGVVEWFPFPEFLQTH